MNTSSCVPSGPMFKGRTSNRIVSQRGHLAQGFGDAGDGFVSGEPAVPLASALDQALAQALVEDEPAHAIGH